jgi:predicted DCC family thiol-disulfide oxidoreductase YuxK
LHFIEKTGPKISKFFMAGRRPAARMTAEIASSAEIRLPSPAEIPSGDIVIYDGHCKFCTAMTRNLAAWDAHSHKLAFLSLHDPEVQKRFPQLTHEQLMKEMYVVDRRGKYHKGAEAFRYLTTRLPRLCWLAPLMFIPFSLPLWRWGYRQIARRRYALMGKTHECDGDACRVHFK